MKRFASLMLIVASVALTARAQNSKEMTLALQRDVAALSDEVKRMKSSEEQRLAVISETLRNTLDLVTRINEKMAVMQTNTSDKMNEITRQVAAPTQALAQKVDGMNDQFLNLSNTIAELNSRIGKLDAKLEDVKKMVQSIPPPAAQSPQTGPPQPVNGEKMFDDANRDYTAGNYDLALQGFSDYSTAFPEALRASDAQFFIGEIYARKNDLDNAVKAYDAVITNFPDANRVANAHYMKGVTLAKLERNAAAAKEFRIVIAKYPSTELAKNSRDYLKALGVAPAQAPPKKRASR